MVLWLFSSLQNSHNTKFYFQIKHLSEDTSTGTDRTTHWQQYGTILLKEKPGKITINGTDNIYILKKCVILRTANVWFIGRMIRFLSVFIGYAQDFTDRNKYIKLIARVSNNPNRFWDKHVTEIKVLPFNIHVC